MYGSPVPHGGETWWDYNESGGGGCGGPQGIWMTFFNGYTAVLLSNTGSNKISTSNINYPLMENSFLPALTP